MEEWRGIWYTLNLQQNMINDMRTIYQELSEPKTIIENLQITEENSKDITVWPNLGDQLSSLVII